MPKDSLTCTENDCELGHDLANKPKDDQHIKDYHRRSSKITDTLYTVEFTRTPKEWSFQCDCGGMYKNERSFSRHIKGCEDMSTRIDEAVQGKEEVSTESFIIKPIIHRSANTHGSIDKGDTINTKLLMDIVKQLQSNSYESKCQTSRLEELFINHNNTLELVQSQQDEAAEEIKKLKQQNVDISQTVKYLGSSLTQLEKRVYIEPEPQWSRKKACKLQSSQSRGQDIRTFLSAEPLSRGSNGEIKEEKQ
jgi:hypothetical protein